jgi:hypothetical protein
MLSSDIVDKIVKADLLKADLLKAYLQRTFNLSSDQLDNDFFPDLLSLNLSSSSITSALNASFTPAGSVTPSDALDDLLKLMRELERSTLLFEKTRFDPEMISFFVANKEVFGITDLRSLGFHHLVNMVRYHGLLDQKADQREAVNRVLQNIQQSGSFVAADNATLAAVLLQPESLIASLTSALGQSVPALDAI